MKSSQKTHSRGQTLVEWAFILPIMLLIVIMIVDLGRAVYTWSVLYNATREGARYGIIHPTDPSGIQTEVRARAIGLDPAQISITISQPTTRTLRVFASYPFTVITPLASLFLGGSNTITMSNAATMQVE